MTFRLSKTQIHGIYSVSFPDVFHPGERRKYHFNGKLEDLIQHIHADIAELENLQNEAIDFFTKYPEEKTVEAQKDLINLNEHKNILINLANYLLKKSTC